MLSRFWYKSSPLPSGGFSKVEETKWPRFLPPLTDRHLFKLDSFGNIFLRENGKVRERRIVLD